MKRRTDILTHLLLLLLVLVACTADDAIKENLSHQDEYVTVRMHIPGMKAVATRAAETDNITSIVALVFSSDDKLKTVTEYSTTNSALHPISPISGTITINKPDNGDVIHFLANLPADYSNEKKYIAYLNEQLGKSQTDVLCNLSSRDYDKLSYWGMATRNDNNAVMDVMLYRNKAMIEIKPGADCTFRQDELFIAGLDNPNNVGLLVPYNDGFNFDLGSNDYLTLPQNPDPLDKTDELTNFGAGYDNAYYVFEHANPNNADGLYVICKIGDDYYKVALHDEKGQPYPIIRNHKYTILVNDLDAGCKTYSEALSAEPIKPTVIETKDVTFTYTDNAMLNLNDNDTYTVTMDPNGGILTSLSIAAEGFTVASSIGGLTGPTNNVYTYAGGYTQFTFTPTSAGSRTIRIYNGQGENINVPEKNISVTVNATINAEADKETIYHDGNDKTVTVRVTIPKGVSGLNISAPDFNYGDDTDGSYTYNRGDATTETTVQLEFTLKDGVTEDASITFSDASANANVEGLEVNINVEQTPIISFSKKGTQTITLNGSPLSVEMDTYGKSLSEFGITVTPAIGLNVTQDGTQLTLNNDGVYSTNAGVSGTPTFTFTPTAAGTYTITFSGSGTDVNMPQESERTINLTVNAAAVTTMSATAVNDDSTIDLDSGDTNVTFTLTKPSSVGQLNIGVKDANSTNVKNNFSITADGQSPWNNNDNQDDGYYYNVNNNSETVTITVALKNGFNTAGTYTITISDYNKTMSATATITIKKTPTVSFSNTSDKTLYWNNGNPTSFDVEMTGVPDGKNVTLSITNASAFTITASSGTLSATNNGYSYTGGNTTFTIKPKDANSVRDAAYSIGFSGTGDGVIVPNTSISVKVEATQPAVQGIVIFDGGENGLQYNWPGDTPYDVSSINDYVGGKLKIDIVATNGGQIQFYNVPGNNYVAYTFTKDEARTFEFTIVNSSPTQIKINGEKFKLMKIYIVP